MLSEHQLIGGVEHGEDGLRDPLHPPVAWVLLDELVVLVLIDGEVPLIEELEVGDVRVEDARIQSDLPRCLLLSPVRVERRGHEEQPILSAEGIDEIRIAADEYFLVVGLKEMCVVAQLKEDDVGGYCLKCVREFFGGKCTKIPLKNIGSITDFRRKFSLRTFLERLYDKMYPVLFRCAGRHTRGLLPYRALKRTVAGNAVAEDVHADRFGCPVIAQNKNSLQEKDYSSGRSMARSGMSFVMSRIKTRRTDTMTSGSSASGLCGMTTSARMAVSEVR